MMVYVERRVADDVSLSKDEAFGSIRNQLCTFREGESWRTCQCGLPVNFEMENFKEFRMYPNPLETKICAIFFFSPKK